MHLSGHTWKQCWSRPSWKNPADIHFLDPQPWSYSEGREKLDIKCTSCALALRDMCTWLWARPETQVYLGLNPKCTRQISPQVQFSYYMYMIHCSGGWKKERKEERKKEKVFWFSSSSHEFKLKIIKSCTVVVMLKKFSVNHIWQADIGLPLSFVQSEIHSYIYLYKKQSLSLSLSLSLSYTLWINLEINYFNYVLCA